eukprot:1150342-Pelagomonas_calceolata.AAC.8
MQAQLLQADIKIKPNQLSCQCRQLTWSALGLFGDALDGVALPAVDLHTLAHNTKAASAHHAPDKEQAVQLDHSQQGVRLISSKGAAEPLPLRLGNLSGKHSMPNDDHDDDEACRL